VPSDLTAVQDAKAIRSVTRAAVEEGILPAAELRPKTGNEIVRRALSRRPRGRSRSTPGLMDRPSSARSLTPRTMPTLERPDRRARLSLQGGVIEPAKVVRTALQDAASVAGLRITRQAMIVEKLKKETAPAMPAGDMDF
jgi:hypothetical protein